MVGQIHRIGGVAQLVVDNIQGVMRFGQVDHILKLAVSHDYGIYHCTGSGICSWYDFASEIIRLSGLPCTVKPVTSAQYKEMNPKSADRPAWSALENRALRCSVGDDMRDWKDAIQDFFNNWDGK